jgi:hypothetical protein
MSLGSLKGYNEGIKEVTHEYVARSGNDAGLGHRQG